ncbi:PPE family protein [Mycobacterium sp. pUA109]|uniref:PPE family protein n=1 Tax=Mycobacterium sp. pUA109 TaxID=3238982 RepID=UPI00351BBA6E
MLTPEVISTQMYTGPGSAPLTAAAMAWDGLSTELASAAVGYRWALAGLAGAWSGPSAAAMQAAAQPYIAWLESAAATAHATAAQARAAVLAYETAHAAVVPPAAVYANRAQLAVLVATNLLGQNTALIAANEAQYAAMWAADLAAMGAYASASTAATQLPTFTPAPQTAQPLTQATQQPADTTSVGSIISQLLGGQTVPGWLDETFQSLLSSGPWQAPTDVLALLTGLWAVSSAASLPDVLNRIRNTVDVPPMPIVPAPTVPKVHAHASAAAGNGNRIGRLSVPSSWAQPPTAGGAGGAGPAAAALAAEERAVPLAMPLGAGQRNGERRKRPDPEYGIAPKVVPRPPSGG